MKIILIGSSGAMGKVLAATAQEAGHTVVAGLQIPGEYEAPFPTASSFDKLANLLNNENVQADVIIDFSSPALTEELMTFAVKHNLPVMLATTGHTEGQEEAIRNASQHVGILNTHNTSIGVNVMQQIVKQVTKSLYPLGYDIEIMEKHHRYKKDSPSGTAIMLLKSIEEGMGEKIIERHGREGDEEARLHNEVGIHAIRGGDIVGEHTVLFANNQEVIEITHKAGSKEIFAQGAIAGALFLTKHAKPGLFDMNDVL